MKNKTKSHPDNSSFAEENIYTDMELPWIEYHGFRNTNQGARNRWFIHNLREQTKLGPQPSLRLAWAFVHQVSLSFSEKGTVQKRTVFPDSPSATRAPIERIIETENPLSEVEMAAFQVATGPVISETNGSGSDQLLEFSCPHCGKGIIGLLARR